MAGSDITIEILKEIRRDVRDNSKRLESMDQRLESMDQRLDSLDQRLDSLDQHVDSMDQRLALTDQRIDITNERLGVVESTLLTLARRQRLTLRFVKANAEATARLDGRVTDLEARVTRLENR